MNVIAVTRAVLDRHAAFSMVDQVFVSGLNFVIGIVAARLLGVADFGTFTLILMVSTLTLVVQHNFLCLPMMTLAGARPMRSDGYYAGIWRLSLGASVLSAIIVGLFVIGVFVLRGRSAPAELVFAAMFATFAQNQQIVVRRILFAERRGGAAVGMDVARFAILLVGAGVLYAGGISFNATSVLALLGACALGAIVPTSARLAVIPVRALMLRATISRHWPLSRWMLLLFIISLGQEQVLWIFTGIQLGDEAVGGLRAGQYLLGLTHFILHALENFVPNTSAERLRLGGSTALLQYLARQTLVLGGAMLALIIALALFATPAISLVFGADYAVYGEITQIMALAYGAIVIRSIWVHYLRAIENTRSVFFAYVASSLTAVVLIAPMIEAFGLAGAAWTISIAQCVCLAATLFAVVISLRETGCPVHAVSGSPG